MCRKNTKPELYPAKIDNGLGLSEWCSLLRMMMILFFLGGYLHMQQQSLKLPHTTIPIRELGIPSALP
ncbi:Protein transport protein SEC31 [Fusarium oxysporum f. sp. albedinis]|nr:Protein transport protein SEC31 [Fusarium oxysporum f. sp. albedinis]